VRVWPSENRCQRVGVALSQEIQPIASGVSFLHSRIPIDNLVFYVSFTAFR